MQVCRICVVNIHAADSQLFCTGFRNSIPFLPSFTLSAQRAGMLQAALAGEPTFCLHLPAIQTALSHCVACTKKTALVNSLHGYKVHITLEGNAIQTHEVAQQRLYYNGLQNTLLVWSTTNVSFKVDRVVNVCTNADFVSCITIKICWYYFFYNWNGFNIYNVAVTLRNAKCMPTVFQSRINNV